MHRSIRTLAAALALSVLLSPLAGWGLAQDADDPVAPAEDPDACIDAREHWMNELLGLEPLPEDATVPDAEAEPAEATAVALRALADRVRTYPGEGSEEPMPQPAAGEQVGDLLIAALYHLTDIDIAHGLTDRQARLAVTAGIAMLTDGAMVSDASACDGPRILVMHSASEMLDAIVGSSPGRLQTSGGLRPSYYVRLAYYLNPRIPPAWDAWWNDAAGQPREDWHIRAIPVPSPEELDPILDGPEDEEEDTPENE